MTGDPPSSADLERVADPGALLPEEPADSGQVSDALHWIEVYSELERLKTTLLDRANQVLAGVSDDAMKEANIDQRLLQARAERCRRRREFWTRRARELAGP